MWFSGIVAQMLQIEMMIAYLTGKSPSIFTSFNLFPFVDSSTYPFSMVCSINFVTSPDILSILRQSIIQLYRIILYAILSSSNTIARSSVSFCSHWGWSLYCRLSLTQVPFQHPFFSPGNSTANSRLVNSRPVLCRSSLPSLIFLLFW